MMFNTEKHILGLELHPGGNRYTGNRQTDRQTHNQTTVCPHLRMRIKA